METGFLALSQGAYEWTASVEEVVAQGRDVRKVEGRKRAATGELDGVGEVGRRMWVAEEPCVVHARDDGDEVGIYEEGDQGRDVS